MNVNILYTPPRLRILLIENSGVLCLSNVEKRNVVTVNSWDEDESA